MSTKVCHFTSTHAPKDQRIFFKECISLKRAGYNVTLVEQGNNDEISGVKILGTGEKKTSRLYRLLIRPQRIYQKAKRVDADIYHFHDMELIPYGLKLKKKGKKVIFDYHEDYASRFSESDALFGPKFLKKLLGRAYCKYEEKTLCRFDAIISVTPHICERLSKYNPETYMITNYPLTDSEQWNKHGVYNEKSDYIAFAGQIGAVYKIPLITKAIQKMPNVRFKICGPIRKQKEFDEIIKVDIKKKVEYLGTLPYMEVPLLLSNSRAAIVLCEHNVNTAGDLGTLGNNKIFEYMICGVPIICTDFILWKEIVERYKCGICIDDDSIEKAINYIFRHPEEAKKMGENGRRAVIEEYNWKSQEVVLLKLYKKLVEGQRYVEGP